MRWERVKEKTSLAVVPFFLGAKRPKIEELMIAFFPTRKKKILRDNCPTAPREGQQARKSERYEIEEGHLFFQFFPAELCHAIGQKICL